MKLVTKVRLILIPLMILMLSVFGMVLYSIYIDDLGDLHLYKTDGSLYWLTVIFITLNLYVPAFILYRIFTRTLVITIDENNKIITFFYPFKYSKHQYGFNEIITFSFSSWLTKACVFKRINFKTENNIYTVTDFEIANFRDLEKYAIRNFNLSKGKGFEFINEIQKGEELENSMKFDISQAKDFRITCYMLIGLAVFIMYMDASTIEPKIGLGGNIFVLCCLLFSLSKIIQATRIIKNSR